MTNDAIEIIKKRIESDPVFKDYYQREKESYDSKIKVNDLTFKICMKNLFEGLENE